MDFWVWWLIAAGGFGIVLLLTDAAAMPEFGMLAAGAVAGSIAAGLTDSLVIQVVVFAIVSTALIVVVQPAARRARAGQPPSLRSGVDALRGKTAVVLERVDGTNGRIKLVGETWSARALSEGDSFEPGSKVTVAEIDGATAIVM